MRLVLATQQRPASHTKHILTTLRFTCSNAPDKTPLHNRAGLPHLHTTAQFPQRASSPWHTHSAHRRTLHTNGHRTPHEPPQFTWPRRRPRAAPALPPTATLLAWHHSQCTFARPGPLPTATQHDPRAQHATAAHHTIQHHQPGEPTPPNSPTSPTSPNSPTFQTSPQPSRRLLSELPRSRHALSPPP